METKDLQRIAQFLFETGTMRKLSRIHRQLFFTDDLTDNIATHSFRVTVIGYFLAQMEKVDTGKVVLMCLTHDMGESRSNDHNWVHKRYVTEDHQLILKEQITSLPFPGLLAIAEEYEQRESKESIIAKDADTLDQLLLLREYEWQGNKEAAAWLYGDNGEDPYSQLKKLKTESAKLVGRAIYDESPSSWWRGLHTSKNRK